MSGIGLAQHVVYQHNLSHSGSGSLWHLPGASPGAAFAMLAGTSPVPTSSGQTVRHRLNRGGDRRLNRALHTIVLARRASHEPTRAYLERRVAEGKSQREAVRCLKRYLARRLYRVLQASATPLTDAPSPAK